MRARPWVVSLAVHGAVLAWLAAGRSEAPRRALAPALARAPAATPAPEPIELTWVTVLDDPAPAPREAGPAIAAPAIPRDRPPRRAARRPAPASAAPPESPPPASPPPASPPPASPPPPPRATLSMRRPGDVEPPRIARPGSDGISDEALEAMVNGELPVKIANLPGAQADADYARASARLRDARWVAAATPEQVAAARLERLAALEARQATELVAQRDGSYTTDYPKTFGARVSPDGGVELKDKPNIQVAAFIGFGLAGTFDLTDAFMRDRGQDPYASSKLRYLDRTRDQRVEIGKRHRAAQLAQSTQLMAESLARLWATTRDPARRKSALFALWDECAETGPEELVEAGAAARRVLVNFVHVKRVVFTPEELAALNAKRRSSATFAP